MKKSIAIVFSVVLAAWIGFMIYQHHKKKQTDDVYVASTYSQMTEAANKSAKAGLTFMGMSLKSYYEKNKKYPEKLSELYPDYLKDKSFIENVNWIYEPGKDDFKLSKTVVSQGRQETAYINKSLMPTSDEDKRALVAARQRPQKATTPGAQQGVSQPATPIPAAMVAQAPAQPAKQLSQEELAKLRKELLEKMADDIKKKEQSLANLEKEEEIDSFYTIAGEAPEVGSDIGERYLVWKNVSGALGFGNIVYPDLRKNLIYKDGKWLTASSATPETPEAREKSPTAGILEKPVFSPEYLVRKHGENYLAWKDQSGAIGFGNIVYPASRDHWVFTKGEWVLVNRAPLDAPGKRPSRDFSIITKQELANRLGRTFLLWKNKNGELGFGNVIYPDQNDIVIYNPGGVWEKTDNDKPSGGPS